MKRFFFAKIAKIIILAPLFILAIGYITMSLWNCLVPSLFHGPVITLWQTFGILLLSKILFGGWKGGGRCCCQKGGHNNWREHMKEKWNNLSTEERSSLKSRFFNKCYSRDEQTDSETKNA
ncbi:MAG: hypothetical protein H7259_06975 [Cytophagales bacterium]|nr:hypothetical protein [Cytophaga sp.]